MFINIKVQFLFRQILLIIVVIQQSVFGEICDVDHGNSVNSKYTIPEARFVVFDTRGFRVSIPDHPGVELFAFHGNINRPLYHLEAGDISVDVVHKRGQRWVYSNRETKLKVGDTVYYWTYVIRNGLGYRYDDGVYHVTELTSREFSPRPRTGSDMSPTPTITPSNDTTKEYLCEKTILNLTDGLLNYQNEVNLLRSRNGILKDIIMTQGTELATQITLEGRFHTNEEPLVTVNEVIRQKLLLTIRPQTAFRVDSSKISFTVATLDEKITLLLAAKEKLTHSKFSLNPRITTQNTSDSPTQRSDIVFD